jgi:L-threonine-O-3-phosphate decarboxylase
MEILSHGGNLRWAANLAGCSPEAIIDFSASINPLGPPKSAIEAIQSHLADLKSYPDPDYKILKTALGKLHQLPPEWILPGNGAAELLTWIAWELAAYKSTYLVTPAFGDYFRALKTFNAKVITCPIDNLGSQDLSLLLDRQNISDSQDCLLLNNPHNPTGQLFSKTEILPYLDKFALVVIDEAFMDFVPSEKQQSAIDLVEKYSNLIILRSLTKFYSLPGLRLGYCIAHPDRLTKWQKVRDPWSVNVLAVAAALAVIEDIDFEQNTRSWLAQTKPQLYQSLAQIPDLKPIASAANYFLVKTKQPSSQLQQKLLQTAHILIRDCCSFPELGDAYFRVAIRTQLENDKLINALSALRAPKSNNRRLG